MSQQQDVVVSVEDQFCRHCQKSAADIGKDLMVCPKCKKFCYCTQGCFKKDWKKHKLVCDGVRTHRKMEDKIAKMHENYLQDPKMRPILQAIGQMEGTTIDENTFNDPTRKARMNALIEQLYTPDDEVKNNLWDKIEGKPLSKRMQKTLQYLEANHGRSVVTLDIYSDLWETDREDILTGFLDDNEMRTQFFDVLAKNMELDIKMLRDMPSNCTEDDMTKPPSFFFLARLSQGIPDSTAGLVELKPERFEAYLAHRCWPLQLELSLEAWNLIKRPSFHSTVKPMFEELNSKMWESHLDAFTRVRNNCRAMLESCATMNDGKPLHDRSSPLMSGLIRLLSIQDGPRKKREDFKAPIYVAAALILLYQKDPRNADLPPADLFPAVLCAHVPRPCFDFLMQVSIPFVLNNLLKGTRMAWRGGLFQEYLESNPSLKAGM